jgi:hypothetical protein
MLPTLRINAWNPDLSNSGVLSSGWITWTNRQQMQRTERRLDWSDGPDKRNWRDPQIGWGVVLPENETVSAKDRALPIELPSKVQEGIRKRNGVVLRYRAELAPEKISRYYADDGHRQDFRVLGSETGIGVGEMPKYLLILASPDEIPWKHQYLLAGRRFVGRLNLPPDALENYFEHLCNEWQGSTSNARSPLVWSVDWGGNDITSLMRHMVAEPVNDGYRTQANLDPLYLPCGRATSGALLEALSTRHPAVIVTTSHGRTSPLDDVAALRSSVGIPVDQEKKTLDVAALLKEWQPDGTIWYAHACCSAGTDAQTSYAGLFEAGNDIDRILRGVANAGSRIAPLPTALLTADKPARAFIGHVEPTFDWPLQDPETGQPLSAPFSDALTKKLYALQRHPVGSAFEEVQILAAAQFEAWYRSKDEAQEMTDAPSRQRKREMALRAQLGGLDWQGVVILGDPTVAVAGS